MSQAVLVTGRTWHGSARGADGGGVGVQQSQGPDDGSEHCVATCGPRAVTGPTHRLPGEGPRALLTNGADSGQCSRHPPSMLGATPRGGGRHSETSSQLFPHLGTSSLPPHRSA